MHICFITSEYPKIGFPHGGVGTFIKTLAHKLIDNGHKVSVVGINYEDKIEFTEDYQVKIYRLKPKFVKGLTWFFHAKMINQQIKFINQNNPIDVVESAELGLAFIKKIPSIKYVIRLHGGHHFFAESENRGVNWWKAFQEKRSFKHADDIIGVSQYVVNHTSKYLNFENKKRGVIFNPANLNNFYKADSNKIISGRIFFAGTLCEKKGIRQLVMAMPLIKKEVPEAHLVIAGRDWFYPKTNQSYTTYLKTFIDESVKNDIFFLGAIDNNKIPLEIEQAEVCCYPSHMEAMPLAWIEVMSMGKAFVGSQLGPGPEIITHEVNGLLCNPLDPDEIAKQVIRLLKDKNFASTLGQNARETVLNKFDAEIIFKQNIAFYQSIISLE